MENWFHESLPQWFWVAWPWIKAASLPLLAAFMFLTMFWKFPFIQKRKQTMFWGVLALALVATLCLRFFVFQPESSGTEKQTGVTNVVQQDQQTQMIQKQEEKDSDKVNWWPFFAVLFGLSFGGVLMYRSWTGKIWQDVAVNSTYWQGVVFGGFFLIGSLIMGFWPNLLHIWIPLLALSIAGSAMYSVPIRTGWVFTAFNDPVSHKGTGLRWWFPLLLPFIGIIPLKIEFRERNIKKTKEFSTRVDSASTPGPGPKNTKGAQVSYELQYWYLANKNPEAYLEMSDEDRADLDKAIESSLQGFMAEATRVSTLDEAMDYQVVFPPYEVKKSAAICAKERKDPLYAKWFALVDLILHRCGSEVVHLKIIDRDADAETMEQMRQLALMAYKLSMAQKEKEIKKTQGQAEGDQLSATIEALKKTGLTAEQAATQAFQRLTLPELKGAIISLGVDSPGIMVNRP
ncbi:hypothetical protein KBC40_00050 [Patescibacteria group bacterium]|nr:hypothetical protein [Patescibacteria group bacterium]